MPNIHSLYINGFADIPTEKGIYIVKIPYGFNLKFLDSTTSFSHLNSKSLLYDVPLLEEKYFRLIDKDILYIGKAACKKGLQQRIRQYINYGYQKSKIHRGGRAIWQIKNCDQLIIEFSICDDCESQEKKLLSDYYIRNGSYPVANWRL